jgi:hypothetical protein
MNSSPPPPPNPKINHKATFSEATPTRKKGKKTPTKGTSSNFIQRDSKP